MSVVWPDPDLHIYSICRWGEDGYVRLSREDPDNCGTNNTPMDGTACTGGPGSQEQTVSCENIWRLEKITIGQVCGECGILFEATYPLGAKKIETIED